MEKLIKAFFEKENIEYFASCKISDEYIALERKLPSFAKYVTVFLVPYKTEAETQNVSVYAVSRDYHFYISELKKAFSELMKNNGVCENFEMFADNSPFYERKLACDMSLGFIGKNGLLINEKYGSFIFVAEMVTEKEICLNGKAAGERKECLSCLECIKACPSKCIKSGDFDICMSALTQKKKLDENEEALVKDHPLVWGCDFCQQVCPHNKNAVSSPIEFFRKERIPYLTTKLVSEMTQDEFSKRAYAWRGKEVLLRNLKLKNL